MVLAVGASVSTYSGRGKCQRVRPVPRTPPTLPAGRALRVAAVLEVSTWSKVPLCTHCHRMHSFLPTERDGVVPECIASDALYALAPTCNAHVLRSVYKSGKVGTVLELLLLHMPRQHLTLSHKRVLSATGISWHTGGMHAVHMRRSGQRAGSIEHRITG
jgi:hypothetical protein